MRHLQHLPLLLLTSTVNFLDELQSLAPLKRDVRFAADALVDEGGFTLFVDGQRLDKAGRVAMLAALKGGDVPPVLEIEAITYLQRETPNRKFVRFSDKILAAFAKSFIGQPFLRDHNSYELEARGGTITSSKLEKLEDGTKAIRMKLSLVKAWAIEGALDGTIDRFSIGWSRTDIVICSVHKTEVFTKCDCMPGMKVLDQVVQFVFTGAEGTEVSAVNVPAVVGTSVQAISQLDALDRDTLAGILASELPIPRKEKPMIDPQILAALGLKSDATLADVLAKIASLGDSLTITASKHQLLATELETLRSEKATREAGAKKVAIDASIAQLTHAGKIKPGSPVETALRSMAGRDMDVFAAQVKDLLETGLQVTPVGQQVVVDGKDPVPVVTPGLAVVDGKGFLAANPETAKWLNKAGITQEQFDKHGAQAREAVVARQS